MIKDKKKYNILIIEDNPGDYLLIEEFIAENIYEPNIFHANNFKEARVFLKDPNNSFDIILMDLTLPDKRGDELVTEMVRFLPHCPIIILTGYADIDFSIQSISRGISDYLLKDELGASMLFKSIIYAIERKKSFLLVEESEKRYSNLFHLSPQPMWLHDSETLKFIQVNKAAIEHYGYSEALFLTMGLKDIQPAQIPFSNNEEKINRAQVGESTFTGSFNHVKKNGEIINVEVYCTDIMVKDRKCSSVIAVDVTERNQYEHKITKAIIKTQEEERYEIGGELHDNVCQILATSMISLGMMKKYIEPTAEQWFKNTKDYITMATDEIRNLSHRLAPAFFDDSNFEVAVEILLNTFNAADDYEITLQFDNKIGDEDLSLEMQLNLYRIVQEQLRNILKYAKATKITVDIFLLENMLILKLTDNGVGFILENAKSGIGLANMKRRAELFSGIFEIKSSPGNGCTITVSIPIPPKN
ncbi:MAG: response regulator [Pedobacter sp.]|nr:response regulator [Pedobacter sp.]